MSDRLARARADQEATRRACQALAGVLAILDRQKGYMAPEDQRTLREAKATLAELWATNGT